MKLLITEFMEVKSVEMLKTKFDVTYDQELSKNPSKLNYFYILTPKGITEKTKLTLRFMKRKLKEYDELKKDLSNES